MKKNSIIPIVAILMLVTSGIQCGKDDPGGVFIPDLSAVPWVNKADATNTFFFLVPQTNVNTSTFTGNENPIGGGAQYRFSGSFNNHDIQFTYDNNSGAKSNKSYSGTINDASNVITLTSSTMASIVLQK
jgi:hypothetical protein